MTLRPGDRRAWLAVALCLALTGAWPGNAGAGTVATGTSHTLVVTSAGEVWAWGSNASGQLGIGQAGGSKVLPTQVTALSGVIAVAAGTSHSLTLKSDGTVWAFGIGTSGQLGQGLNSSSNVPVQVSGLAGIAAIAAGENHGVALKDNGAIYTWGVGTLGQLGDGGTGNRNTPYLVTGLQPVAAIAAGGNHTLAVLSSVSGSTMKAWGKNVNAQLGAGYASSGATSNPVSVNLLSGVASAAAGTNYSLAVKSDSTAYGWGHNAYYQIGDNTNTQRLEPVALYSAFSGVATVVAGQYNSFAIKGDGSLWAWGENSLGQLATGNTTASHYPIAVPGFASVSAVGAGANRHTIIVTTSGEVWAAGYNLYGQLGDGTAANRTSPVKIAEAGFNWKVGTPTFVTAPSTYYEAFNLALSWATAGATIKYTTDGTDPSPTNGTTYTAAFQIGASMTVKAMAFKAGLADSNIASGAYNMKVQLPTFAPGPATYTSAQNVAIATITTGDQIFYTTNGSEPTPSSTLYTGAVPIGTNTTLKARGFKADWTDSELKSGTYTMNFGTLTAPVASPVAGTYVSSVEVTLTAQAGSDIYYTTNNTTPTTSSALYTGSLTLSATTTLKAKAFRIDYTASAVTTALYTIQVATPTFDRADGSYPVGTAVTVTDDTPGASIRFTTDGSGPTSTSPTIASGQTLILGNYTLKAKATKAGCIDSGVASAVYSITGQYSSGSVAAGFANSYVLLPDGTVYAFGYDGFGSLGDGVLGGSASVPQRINSLTGIVAIAAGYGHALALDYIGRVWSFGLNTDGQVGDNSQTNRPGPAVIGGLTGVVAIGAGAHHSMALTGDGQFWVWGDDSFGQLGRGTTSATPVKVPLQHPTLTDVVAMTGGQYFTLVRHSDGSIDAFGQNDSGQIGTGTFGGNIPTPAQALTTATGIAAGYTHALAVKTDGSAASWGSDTSGQLGDPGVGGGRATAGPVSGLTNVAALAGGEGHSLARTVSGAAWSFGANDSGQIGVPGVGSSGVPLEITGLGDVISVAAGKDHSLALNSAQEVWAWGANSNSQLGDGTTVLRNAPVKVFDAGFQAKAATPTFLPLATNFFATTSITVSSINPGAEIHYTTSGAEPTLTDPIVVSGGAVTAEQSLTLKAKAWLVGVAPSNTGSKTITLTVPALSVAPGGGPYSAPVEVVLTSTISGVTIRYTTDGSLPTESSPSVPPAGTVTVDRSMVLKAKGWKTGWEPSAVLSVTYTLKAALPELDPAAGSYDTTLTVTLTSSPGSTIHYTTDGSTPTLGSPSVPSEGTVVVDRAIELRAFAERTGWTSSAVVLAFYVVFDDADDDLLERWQELQIGSDPNDSDTNDDGILDGVAFHDGLSVTNLDMDGDGIQNAAETAQGTDPLQADTDGDGVGDGVDCFPLDATSSQCPNDPNDHTPPQITLSEPPGAVLVGSAP